MDGINGSYVRQPVHLLDWPRLVVCDAPSSEMESALTGPHKPREFALRLYAWESLASEQEAPRMSHGAEPYTLPWFLSIEAQRHGRQGRWIPKLLEFARHPGETLLGLGNGMGTDWLQFARHGASVAVCSPSAGYLEICKRNFELRGLSGRFLHSPPESLPLPDASIDVTCLSGLLHETDHPETVVGEMFRVLKPGGKVIVVAAARFDVDWWYHACFPWQRWLSRRRERRSITAFSAKQLRELFGQFVDYRVHKRHLSRSDVPRIWRWAPRSALERLMGRVLILKAFKPVSAAIPTRAAA